MRLFAAIDIPDQIRQSLADTVQRLKPTAKARWSKPENLHITTKFLGEVPAAKLDAVIAALRAMPSADPIPVEVRGFGWLPNPKSPRLLFAGIQAPEWLGQLHARTDRALQAVGVPAETKPFRPHLTIARVDAKLDLSALRQAILDLPSCQFGGFTAERFHLYESLTGGTGSVYRKLADFAI